MTTKVTATLPDLDLLNMRDFEYVYEPSDDTFLLCDALEGDREELIGSRPKIALEIGSGSGCVITFLGKLLQDAGIPCHCMATDINRMANEVTQKLSRHNKVFVDIINTDLVNGFENHLRNKVDVLLFNPPYVPTPDEEVGGCGIEASWAGGEDGRVVIDRFLPLLKLLLSPQGGKCYIVLVSENNPKEIIAYAKERGMDAKIVLKRQARNEGLMILKIWNGDPGSVFI